MVSATDEWADPAAERLRRIEPLIDQELLHLELDDLLVELLNRAREALHADTAAVLLLDPNGHELVATAASGLEEEVRQGVRIPIGAGFAGRVAASSAPVVLTEVNERNVVNPILLEAGVRSLLGVPLVAEGRLLGVVHVGTLTPRVFSPQDVELLQVVAGQAALAAQARLSRAERAAARALQISLLPPRLPSLPGLQLAGRYLPGHDGGVSGDWYDAFILPTGQLAVVIGDAMGHGLHASVVMSRLRSTLRAYAIESTDPADVLTRLDRKLQHFEPSELATVLYAIIDRSLETIRYASAGHLMPVLAVPGSPARMLEVKADAPLGVPDPPRRRTHYAVLPPESLLLCYTDGLVERRDAELDDRLRQLCQVTVAGPPEAACAAAINTLLGAERPRDDVALLAAWRHYDLSVIDETVPVAPAVAMTPTSEGVAISSGDGLGAPA